MRSMYITFTHDWQAMQGNSKLYIILGEILGDTIWSKNINNFIFEIPSRF
jgi:hypothetical protein